MAPSAAEAAGYERASKTPKSTRFGRQNPIAARWNSDEQLVLRRSAWADVTNRYLERIDAETRIDHRSHADRGILEQPTIHEGVTVRAMEQQGFIADRCELNRQIKADNKLLRELAKRIAQLSEDIKELRSEKAMILSRFDKTDDDGMKEVKKWVASMESSLQRLEQTEAKYQAESFRDYYDEIEVCEVASGSHYKNAHQTRNRAMVDRSGLVVFCIQRGSGGAWQTMKYAKKQGTLGINLNDHMEQLE